MDLSELDDEPTPKDFRRANGAPLVRSLDDKRWERYARPSGFGHDLDDESALHKWIQYRAIEGVALSPALAAQIAAHIGQKEGSKDRLEKAIQIGRGEEAADLGTALHAMAHRLETEEGFRAPEPHASDLAAYLGAIDAAGLESTHCEVHVCADAWRAAGTPDRIYRLGRELRSTGRVGGWRQVRASSVTSKPARSSTTRFRDTRSSWPSTPTAASTTSTPTSVRRFQTASTPDGGSSSTSPPARPKRRFSGSIWKSVEWGPDWSKG